MVYDSHIYIYACIHVYVYMYIYIQPSMQYFLAIIPSVLVRKVVQDLRHQQSV